MTRRNEFWAGVRNTVPILVGDAFGLFFGALAIGVGLTPFEAQGFSLIVFAGSAQVVAVDLIGRGAAPAVIVLTIFIINLRHALYSASLAPHVAWLPFRWRAAMAWLLTDEAFAVSTPRYRSPDLARAHWFLLGSGLALYIGWQLSTAVGIVLGAQIPESWSLDFILPLMFLAMLIPSLTDRPSWAAGLTGAVFSVILHEMPYGLGLVVAAAMAVAVGVVLEIRSELQEPT